MIKRILTVIFFGLCICFISGCGTLLYPKNGRCFAKDDVLVSGKIPRGSKLKFNRFSVGSYLKPIQILPDIEIESGNDEFVHLKDIDHDYLSTRAKMIIRYFYDKGNLNRHGKTWSEDVILYELRGYIFAYSKTDGLVSLNSLANPKLRSKGKIYNFPVTIEGLIEIFGKPDKVYKTFTPW